MRPTYILPLCLLLGGCILDEEGTSDPSALDGAGVDPNGDDPIFDPGEGEDCVDDGTMNTYGLCLCDAFNDVGRLRVQRAIESMPASVGVNGMTRFVNAVEVDGGWFGYGGINAVAASLIEGDVLTTGDFNWVGKQTIGGDLEVGGDLKGTGLLEVDGELSVGGKTFLIGPSVVGGRGNYEAPDGPPCPCDGDSFFDVEAAVKSASQENDNDVVGLSPEGQLTIGASQLTLQSGRYYVGDFAQVGSLHLRIEGNVTLYVDGDMLSVGAEWLEIADGASLDLYVAGRVGSVGYLQTGNEETAARFRLAIGGPDAVMLNVGKQDFYGHIYAPTADIRVVGDTLIHGSLFANRITGVGNLTIVHTSAEAPPPEHCGGTAEPPR